MNTFNKIERLKNKKLIERLFDSGQSITVFPLKAVYLNTSFEDEVAAKVGVSVSKRLFGSAVDRNRIKRLLREVYRLNRNDIFNNMTTQCAVMILYIGVEKPSFEQLDEAMVSLLTKLHNKLSNKK